MELDEETKEAINKEVGRLFRTQKAILKSELIYDIKTDLRAEILRFVEGVGKEVILTELKNIDVPKTLTNRLDDLFRNRFKPIIIEAYQYVNAKHRKKILKYLKGLSNLKTSTINEIKEEIKIKEKENSEEAPRPELKVGDNVKLIESKKDIAHWFNDRWTPTINSFDKPRIITKIEAGRIGFSEFLPEYNPECFELVKPKDKITPEIMRNYFEEIKKDVKTLSEGKEASLKKWRYIRDNYDLIDWEENWKPIIWNRCGLCVFFHGIEMDGCIKCPLNCSKDSGNISYDLREKQKPKLEDINNFIEKIEEIEPKEWIDITKECEFKPDFLGEFYHMDIIYNNINLGFLLGNEDRGWLIDSYRSEYKIEFTDEKHNHFKILKRGGSNVQSL